MQENRKREIRIEADGFREKCKISRFGIMDLFKDCERMGYKLIRYPLGETADLGFAMIKDGDTVIFTNSSCRFSREIFTLAHEIGHVLLHMCGESPYIDDAITISGRSTDATEQEANYFAACLLMPSDEVDRFFDTRLTDLSDRSLSAMDIARMMSEFNVSFDMALNRLENLGKIDANEHQRLDNEKNEHRVGKLLQSVGGNAKLNMPGNVTDIPYEYINYVIYNYNHSAIPLETLEKALKCYHLNIEDISDRLVVHEVGEDDDLSDMIGGLED